MLSSNILQYNVNTTFMEVLAWKDGQSYSMVKTFGLTTFHLTDFLEMQFQQWSINSQHKPCIITWLTVYRQSPYRCSRDMQVHYKCMAEFEKTCFDLWSKLHSNLMWFYSSVERQQTFDSTTAPLGRKSKSDIYLHQLPLSFRENRRQK